MNKKNGGNKKTILSRIVTLGLSINYFSVPRFVKKIVYFLRDILNTVAFQLNYFDKKPIKKIIPFAPSVIANNKKGTFALLVHTIDRYEFLRKGFHYFFSRSWKNPSTIQKYFLSETKQTNFAGRNSLLSGAGAWNQRLIRGLEHISEPYIIYLQEDFWILKEVETDHIQTLVDVCVQYDLPMLKIHDNLGDKYMLETTDKQLYGKAINRVNKNSDYIISHAVSIRKKEFLLEILNANSDENPRDNELKGTFRIKFARDKELQIYQYDFFSRNINNDDTCFSAYREVCSRGKYNGDVREFIDEFLLHKSNG